MILQWQLPVEMSALAYLGRNSLHGTKTKQSLDSPQYLHFDGGLQVAASDFLEHLWFLEVVKGPIRILQVPTTRRKPDALFQNHGNILKSNIVACSPSASLVIYKSPFGAKQIPSGWRNSFLSRQYFALIPNEASSTSKHFPLWAST